MPRRKPQISEEEFEVLERLHLRLRLNTHCSADEKIAFYTEAKKNLGPELARIATMLIEANVPLNQITQHFEGQTTMTNNNPGGQNITQTAGGNMTGVNASGEQKIRDIQIYSQDLDQSTAVKTEVRNALVAARRSIETSGADTALISLIIEQFDKLTEELKKGSATNPTLLKTFWNMVWGAAKELPRAAIAYLEKLKELLGL